MTQTVENPVLVDTPEAYEPSFQGPGQRFFPNVPELRSTLAGLEDFNDGIITTEEEKLGVRLEEDPEGFLEKHNEFVAAYAEYLKGVYPAILKNTVERLARHMGRGNAEATARWMSTLGARAQTLTGIHANDHLRTSRLGDTRNYTRSIVVNSLFGLMEPGEGQRMVEGAVIPHEIIHLVSTAAVEVNGKDLGEMGKYNLPVRGGISTVHQLPAEAEGQPRPFVHGATWLNEAATEDLRSRISDDERVAYVRGVALLRAMKDYDPTLDRLADEAVLGNVAPATVIERAEMILGPLGVDIIEPFVSDRTWDAANKKNVPKYSDEAFIDRVVSLVPERAKAKIEALLRQRIAGTRSAFVLPANLESMHNS